jgi:hypothetical protein
MEEARLKAARVLGALACLCILAFSVAQVHLSKLDIWRTLGLVAWVAFFEAWQIRYPWGRPVRLGIAVGLCVVAIRPVPEALIIFFLGSVLGRAFSRSGRVRMNDFYYIFQRTIILALAGLVYALLSQVRWQEVVMRIRGVDPRLSPEPFKEFWVHYPGPDNYGPVPNTYCNPVVIYRAIVFPLAFAAMSLVYYALEMVTSSIETGMVKSGSWRVILPHQVRQTWPLYLSLFAGGGLMALYFPRLPFWNFLIFFFPLMLVRLECNRDKELDQRFFSTVRVVGDAADSIRGLPGHSSRVSNLSVEVARCMGLPEDQVRNLRYAAVLHDIGLVTDAGGEGAAHARSGAELLEEVPQLRRVAEMVRFHHHEPLSEEEVGARKGPPGSKIINVISSYDHLVSEGEKRMTPEEALRELSLERGRRYDSVVLRFLGQVLERRRRDQEEGPRRERRQKAGMLEDMEISLEEIFREEKEE